MKMIFGGDRISFFADKLVQAGNQDFLGGMVHKNNSRTGGKYFSIWSDMGLTAEYQKATQRRKLEENKLTLLD